MNENKLKAYDIGTHHMDRKIVFHYSEVQAKVFLTNLEGWDGLSNVTVERIEKFDKYLVDNTPHHFDQSVKENQRAFYDENWLYGSEEDLCSCCEKGIYKSIPESWIVCPDCNFCESCALKNVDQCEDDKDQFRCECKLRIELKEKEIMESKLIVGAKIKIGEKYAKEYDCELEKDQVITLILGEFEYDDDYTGGGTWYVPSYFLNSDCDEPESIYHLFGNNLDGLKDCEIINENELELECPDCKKNHKINSLISVNSSMICNHCHNRRDGDKRFMAYLIKEGYIV